MRSVLFLVFGILIAVSIVVGLIYTQNTNRQQEIKASEAIQSTASPVPTTTPSSPGASVPTENQASPTPQPSGVSMPHVDLTVDGNGLSKATVVLNTSQGVIKFRFYSNDAPKTVRRIAELITSHFYDGLTFHRVVPGFVIQGGDPRGDGTGGSGQKLEAEFNQRRHVEGTVAMARAADPNSADSQFYIALGAIPHLDHKYTVFGQVVEGLDVVKKIKMGDKINSAIVQ